MGQGTIASTGGSGTITVSTTPECAWTASVNASWITSLSPSSGQGAAEVHFQVTPNTSTSMRQADIVLNGVPARISQAGAACTYALTAPSQTMASSGGPGTVGVVSAADCAWTASSNAPWITVTAGAAGSGNGTVGFSVSANAGSARTDTIAIAGQTFTVNQAAAGAPVCTYSINPPSQSMAATAGAGSPVAVTAGATCAWTSSKTDAWITITSGLSGTGNGTVGLSVTANSGAQRVGVITIAGQSHTVTQASGCSFSINPASHNYNKNDQISGPVNVTTGASCPWTAISNDSWITVETGASGTGNGTVTFHLERNITGKQRVGTLTIAGRTFTVTQDK